MGCGPEGGESAGKFDRERGRAVISRKYDTLLVHAENVHVDGHSAYFFCDTRYDPPKNIAHVRAYIRVSGCVNITYMYIFWGGSFPWSVLMAPIKDCWPNQAAFIPWKWVTFGCGEGVVEFEAEGSLVQGNTCIVGCTTVNGQEACPFSVTIEEFVLETGAKEMYAGTCEIFRWIGDVFITIAQILRGIGDRMGTVWFVGDVIQAWFNAAAEYFEDTRDWFYTAAEWCEEVVASLLSVDVLTWLLGFFSDPGGYIMGFLGSVWTDLQDMYANFDTWVYFVLGDAWTWLQTLHSDFTGAVTSILGDTWTWLQGLYSDFSGAVTSILGDTWTWVLGLYGDFTGAVTGALGGIWTWLTEFVNDPMSKLDFDILDLVKSGFEWLTQEWFSFIDSTWDTFKGSFTWLMQKFFMLLDESWDTFEDSMKWLVGKTMDMIGDAAEDFATKIWEMIEKVVKKL